MFGGDFLCRCLFDWGVSPVLVSTVIDNFISEIGFNKFLATSAVNAFSGDIYKVCKELVGFAFSSMILGKNPAKVLPPPVGAIKRFDRPRAPLWIISR
jgi:hypothetical protein